MKYRTDPPKNYLFYDLVAVTAALPGLIAFRPKLLYESDNAKHKLHGGMLLISNHAGYIDPVYLMLTLCTRRHHFVCTKNIFESSKFHSWLFRQFHCIPIDKENFSISSLRRITDELKAGHLVTMFPEGRVVGEGDSAPFKSGMVLMALQANCPIMPVFIKPQRHFWNRLRLVLGEPVDVRAMLGPRPGLAEIDEAAKLLQEKEAILSRICNK